MSKFPGGGRVAIAVLLIFFYVGYQFYERKQAADALREETLEAAIPTVSITHVQPGEPIGSVTLPGTISAWYQAPIYAQVSGYVKMWYKDYGAKVKKGDILAEIMAPALDAQFAQSKAELEVQRAKYKLAVVTAQRYLALRKSQAVSEQSISVQLANEKAEEAKVNAAQHNVNNFLAKMRFKTLVAPFDGVVTVRNINVGDYVNKEGYISSVNGGSTMTDMFSVADIHKMRLFISVPGTFAYFLKPGLTADVVVPQYPTRHFEAKFLTSAHGVDPNTRTIVTEFTIENEDQALWPGSYATVNLKVPLDTNVLSIPSSALVFEEHGTEVATVTDDNRIRLKPITVTRILDGTIELIGGVTKADRIVNNPSAALLEGDEVRIVEPEPGYIMDARKASEPNEESSSKPSSSE